MGNSPVSHSLPELAPSVLNRLNDAQREAVTHPGGPLLVIAGPGSGKTRVITHRIAWLIRNQQVPPWRILAVTFTNRAAREMKARLDTLVDEQDSKRVRLGTFHSVCVRILRQHGEKIDLPTDFVIYDSDDQLQVIRSAMKEARIDPKEVKPRTALGRISRVKGEGLSLAEFAAQPESYFDLAVSRIWEQYEDELAKADALDFDDLLLRTDDLLRLPEMSDLYTDRLEHVLVDEFQDTSVVQYRLARAWSAGTRNLTVVGDPDQSIYSWRAADVRNLEYLQRDYPDNTLLVLNSNYRSTPQILNAANSLMAGVPNRMDRRMLAMGEDGPLPVMHEAYNESDEAEYIAMHIEGNIRDRRRNAGEFAVLYRTNAQSRPFEESFIQHGIPYRLVGATRFYDRREVRDLLAYLRLVRNPSDNSAFERVVNVPLRGVGAKSIQNLAEWALLYGKSPMDAAKAAAGAGNDALSGHVEPPAVSKKAAGNLRTFVDTIDKARQLAAGQPLPEVLEYLLDKTSYRSWIRRQSESEDEEQERWAIVQELVSATSNYAEIAPGAALDEFLLDVALLSDIDDLPDGLPDAVTLITLHQAKGLEFPVVFIAGMEEDILPHKMSQDDPDQLEEERRLCYVGMTRAMHELHLLYSFRRVFQGTSGHNPPSRFLRTIREEQLSRRGRTQAPVGDDVRPARNRTVSWDDFDTEDDDSFEPETAAATDVGLNEGDEVSHEIFGRGVVISLRTIGRDAEVTVRFAETGVKRLLASMANLTRA